jgi:hypothetical protein
LFLLIQFLSFSFSEPNMKMQGVFGLRRFWFGV